MSVTITTGAALSFDRFWRWLKNHPNCILQAGTTETVLYDHDMMHWHLYEDEERHPVLQLILGKMLIGELILDAARILFVQAAPDAESDEPGQYIFEAMAGPADDTSAVYHFILAHAYDEDEKLHKAIAH